LIKFLFFKTLFLLFQFSSNQHPDLSDILVNLSNLHELEALTIYFPIDIKPQFMANRVSTPNPFQLTTVKRLDLTHTPIVQYDMPSPPIDGLAWCRAIHAVFPNLEELSLRALNEDSLNAIQAHVHLLRLKKCSLVYRQS